MPKKKDEYGNESITMLKGADKVRKRPAVIFGSDSLEGCQHSVFEIISNSIDEARAGFGDKIIITRYKDNVIEVEDLAKAIKDMKKHHFKLMVTSLQTDNSIYDINFNKKIIVIGNEANGVSKEIQEMADEKAKILS